MTREVLVVEFFGLHNRDSEKILHIFDVSYVQKNMLLFFKSQVPGPIQALKL